jgi:hypothetical protein
MASAVPSFAKTVSRAVAAAANYAANDIVSDSASSGAGTAWEFPDMASQGKGGTIYEAVITCNEDAIVARFRLHLFSTTPDADTEMDDNEPKAFDNDDRTNFLGYIDFPAMSDQGEYSMAQVTNLTKGYTCTGTSLYGILEILDAETNETAGMIIGITLYAWKD